MKLRDINIEKVAAAIEADAGAAVPKLREALAEAKSGHFAVIHTPEAMAARKRGRPLGSVKADAKVSTTIRLDQDLLAAIKGFGAGWQTRVNEVLWDDLKSGRLLKPAGPVVPGAKK